LYDILLGPVSKLFGESLDMPLTTLIALLQDAPAASGANTTVKIVSGVLAVILVVIIIMRRKGGKKKEEEEF
jgi:hypothetical protein